MYGTFFVLMPQHWTVCLLWSCPGVSPLYACSGGSSFCGGGTACLLLFGAHNYAAELVELNLRA